jgi:hypothetical protein
MTRIHPEHIIIALLLLAAWAGSPWTYEWRVF